MPYEIEVEYTDNSGNRVLSKKVDASHHFLLPQAKSPDHREVEVECLPERQVPDAAGAVVTGAKLGQEVLAVRFKLKDV